MSAVSAAAGSASGSPGACQSLNEPPAWLPSEPPGGPAAGKPAGGVGAAALTEPAGTPVPGGTPGPGGNAGRAPVPGGNTGRVPVPEPSRTRPGSGPVG